MMGRISPGRTVELGKPNYYVRPVFRLADGKEYVGRMLPTRYHDLDRARQRIETCRSTIFPKYHGALIKWVITEVRQDIVEEHEP